MTRARGFTLLEVMVAATMLAVAAGSIAGVIHQFRSEQAVAREYVEDFEGLRKALRTIEADLLRAERVDGTTIDGVDYVLDERGRLLRDGEPVADSIGSFSIRRRSDFVTVRLAPKPRARGRASSPRALVLQVHLRRMEEIR